MRYLITILLLAFTPKESCIQLDIIIVLDYSGSVSGNEVFITKALSNFVDNQPISETEVKIGIIAFDEKCHLNCPLTSNIDSLNWTMDRLKYRSGSGSTNLSCALMTAYNEFALRNRTGYRKILIVVSDGDVNIVSPEITLNIANQLKDSGIVICGVLIESSDKRPEFMRSISNGCYVESDYEMLSDKLKELNFCI